MHNVKLHRMPMCARYGAGTAAGRLLQLARSSHLNVTWCSDPVALLGSTSFRTG